MRVPKFLYALTAAGALVLTTTTAEAALTLRLSQGVDTVTVTDQGGGDLNSGLGEVTFLGDVGIFKSNISTAFSKPALPNTGQQSWVDLSTANRSTSAGTLVIEFSDTDFTLNTGIWSGLLGVGGTANGTLDVRFYLGLDNALWSDDIEIANFDVLSSGAFSGTDGMTGLDDLSNPFSLTMVATITHGPGTNLTTFDAEGTVSVPTPATLPLFLAGITALGFGAYNARKRRLAAA